MSLLEMSLAGGCIILTAALLRAAAKDRLPAGMFEALWALACLRLTVPVRLPFRLSAWTLLRLAVPHAAGPALVSVAVTVPGQTAGLSADIMQNALLRGRGTPFPVMTVLWLAGVVLLALVFALVYIRGRRSFRTALPADSAYVQEWLRSHPLRRTVRVRMSAQIAAPLTYGVLRPVILLPKCLNLEDRHTLGYVLAHELAHIRRFDAARKLCLAGVLCLHWFNPMVWVMFLLAGRDMELSCDEAVLRGQGTEARKEYAHILLDMEEIRSGFAGLVSGFSRTATEERIHTIMKIRTKSFMSTILSLALVLSVGAAFATAAPEDPAAETAPILLPGDVVASSDGTVYAFTDDGEPVTMTQQEYKALVDPVEVEWWTAEEYASWLEQEKKDLQDCLGQRAWTNTDGWFTWTQEKIDETIEMYEQVLEDIQNGLRVSKPLADGGTLYEGSDTAVQFFSGDTDEGRTARTMTGEDAAAPQAGIEKASAG